MTNLKPKHLIVWSLLAAFCAAQMGCIGLSREHAVQRWGVHARLVDEADSMPISRHNVVVSIDGQKSTQRTDRNGNLRTHSETQPFWTWLGGPILASSPKAGISITTAGYRPYSLRWNDQESGNRGNDKVVRPTFGRPYLDLGMVKLEKSKQDPGASESVMKDASCQPSHAPPKR